MLQGSAVPYIDCNHHSGLSIVSVSPRIWIELEKEREKKCVASTGMSVREKHFRTTRTSIHFFSHLDNQLFQFLVVRQCMKCLLFIASVWHQCSTLFFENNAPHYLHFNVPLPNSICPGSTCNEIRWILIWMGLQQFKSRDHSGWSEMQ